MEFDDYLDLINPSPVVMGATHDNNLSNRLSAAESAQTNLLLRELLSQMRLQNGLTTHGASIGPMQPNQQLPQQPAQQPRINPRTSRPFEDPEGLGPFTYKDSDDLARRLSPVPGAKPGGPFQVQQQLINFIQSMKGAPSELTGDIIGEGLGVNSRRQKQQESLLRLRAELENPLKQRMLELRELGLANKEEDLKRKLADDASDKNLMQQQRLISAMGIIERGLANTVVGSPRYDQQKKLYDELVSEYAALRSANKIDNSKDKKDETSKSEVKGINPHQQALVDVYKRLKSTSEASGIFPTAASAQVKRQMELIAAQLRAAGIDVDADEKEANKGIVVRRKQ